MRIALFDGLLETHVAASLERSLNDLGHSVLNTGKIGHGFRFETDPKRLAKLQLHVDRVVDFCPDLILVFRPASLPPRLLQRLKQSKAHLAVWLSDDPVLWDLSYRPIIDQYDTILHCGAERVLEHYDRHFGRPVGVNVPFWTDNIAFPYIYGNKAPESDALFLGNVQDEVRRRRYFSMGDVKSNIRVHGNVGIDFRNLGGGYLDSDREVVDAAARSRIAVNVSQYFRDHKGLPTWFDGLGELGTFQYPSRVIQYAAMGLPIISVTPTPEDYDTFPEIVPIANFAMLDGALDELLGSTDLADLSERTHLRFAHHYSARSRALALESLLTEDNWRTQTVADRARWFTQFDGLQEGTSKGTEEQVERDQVILDTSEYKVGSLQIALAGIGWTRVTSPVSIAARALKNIGHTVVPVTPFTNPKAFTRDASGEYHSHIRPEVLLDELNTTPDVLLLVGSSYGCTQTGRQALDDAGTALIYHAAQSKISSLVSVKIAQRADAASFCASNTVVSLENMGFADVVRALPMVDESFLDLCAAHKEFDPVVRVIGSRRGDLTPYSDLNADFADLEALVELDDEVSPPKTLDALLSHVRAAATVIAHDREMPDTQASEYFPFALAAGALVITPRIVGDASLGEPGETHLCARGRYELPRKLIRLRDASELYDTYRNNGHQYAVSHLLAEKVLPKLLSAGVTSLNERIRQTPTLQCRAVKPKPGVIDSVSWKLAPSALTASKITLDITPLHPLEVPRASGFELRLILDGDLVAAGWVTDIRNATFVYLTIPAGEPRGWVSVELHAASHISEGNWTLSTAFAIGMKESRPSAAASTMEIGSTLPVFRSAGKTSAKSKSS